MRVLIIGSSSVLGLAAGHLLSQAHTVFYAGRRGGDHHLNLASPNCSLPEGLVFDVVIHAAADFGGESEEDVFRAETINGLGTLKVCRLARLCHAKHLIVISSASANYLPGDGYFGAYSLSKRHGDELAMLYCQKFNLPLTILRPSQIYDAESKCKPHQSLFYFIIEQALNGNNIVFHGTNDALRNYIFIDDITTIICRVLQKKITGLYYCTAKRSIRLSHLARVAYKTFMTNGHVSFDINKPSIPDIKFLSGKDLYEKISFAPLVTIAEGVRRIKLHRESP